MPLQYSDVVANQQGLSRDQLAAQSNAATATLAGTIPVDSLTTPATPLTIPTPTPNTIADATVTNAGNVAKSLTDYINQATPPQTELDKQNQIILDSIASLTGQDTGKTQALAQAKIDSGAIDLQKQLTDLNGQITTGNAEYAKLVADQNASMAALGGNGAPETKAVLSAQQAGLTRVAEAQKASKAADVAMKAAQAQAVSGQLTNALATAQNSVDARYAPIEDELKIKQAQLAALAPSLSKEESIQATALQRQYDDQQTQIAEDKAKAKDNTALALTAGINTQFVNKGGEFFNTTTGQTYKTPEEFFKAAGVTSFDQAYQKGLITDLNNSQIQDISFAQQAQAKYPDVRIPPNATPDQVREILKGSKIYQKETYIAPSANSSGLITANDAITQSLLSSAGQDGKVSPEIYKQTRASAKMSPSDFDARYGYLLSSQEQKNLGITSTKPPTDAQNQEAGFANRLSTSNTDINGLENSIAGMNQASYELQKKLPSSIQTDAFRQYNQAVTNFLTAKLRKESGAAISQSEFDDAYRVYIPQPGDDQKTLDQKEQARNQVIKDITAAAGPAIQGTENSSTQTVQSNGQTYIVGQIYNDGTANWVVDAQGNWKKQ